MSIGRLKRTLGKKCPECGSQLQIRERDIPTIISGISVLTQEEYICCSSKVCYYEAEIEQKRRKVIEIEFKEEPIQRGYSGNRRKNP